MLPQPRPQRLALISGGSGITPGAVDAADAVRRGPRSGRSRSSTTRARRPTGSTAARSSNSPTRHPTCKLAYIATREGGARVREDAIAALLPGFAPADTTVAVCGPPPLLDCGPAIWAPAPQRVLAETFTPPSITVTGAAAHGTLRFLRSDRTTPIGEGTLLEQAEAAGLSPEFGCRMGICHTCTCRKSAGAVRNVLTGEVSDEEDEDIQLCVSVPAGDVALEI